MTAATVAGTAAGAIIGESVGTDAGYNGTQSAITGGVVGAGLGIAAGYVLEEILAEDGEEEDKVHEVVLRRPHYTDEFQYEIDRMRTQMEDSSKYGRNETRSWNDRYLEELPDEPYQGMRGTTPAYQ